ncbi:hypothetical protein UMZ34_01450 [Halopseudomonas pachastrellae]|nr:hypothetical protein UMZ34_01450 [Halopseudomonas pachastrellae]
MSESLQDVNPAVLQALQELMQDDYALLLDTFLGDADLRMRQLREALSAGDMNAFRQAAIASRAAAAIWAPQRSSRPVWKRKPPGWQRTGPQLPRP